MSMFSIITSLLKSKATPTEVSESSSSQQLLEPWMLDKTNARTNVQPFQVHDILAEMSLALANAESAINEVTQVDPDMDLSELFVACSNLSRARATGNVYGNSTTPINELELLEEVKSLTAAAKVMLVKAKPMPVLAPTDTDILDDAVVGDDGVEYFGYVYQVSDKKHLTGDDIDEGTVPEKSMTPWKPTTKYPVLKPGVRYIAVKLQLKEDPDSIIDGLFESHDYLNDTQMYTGSFLTETTRGVHEYIDENEILHWGYNEEGLDLPDGVFGLAEIDTLRNEAKVLLAHATELRSLKLDPGLSVDISKVLADQECLILVLGARVFFAYPQDYDPFYAGSLARAISKLKASYESVKSQIDSHVKENLYTRNAT